MPTSMIEVQINGSPASVPENLCVSELIDYLALGQGPKAIEINESIVPKSQQDSTVVKRGDHIEIVTLVGGG